jgi:hypothetical protein
MDIVKDMTRKTFLNWSIKGLLGDGLYRLSVSSKAETSSWSCQKKGRQYIHKIQISSQVPSMAKAFKEETLVKNHTSHELSHAKYTERDFKKTSQLVSEEGIPFQLLNIAEDIRIEARLREESGYAYNHLSVQCDTINDPSSRTPEALLLSLKWEEEDAGYMVDKFCALFDESQSELADYYCERVGNYYYSQIKEAKDTLALIPILKEWTQEFDESDEQETQQRIDGMIESLIEALQKAGIDPESFIEALFDLQSALQNASDESTSENSPSESDDETNIVAQSPELEKEQRSCADKREDTEVDTVVNDDFTSRDIMKRFKEYVDEDDDYSDIDWKKVERLTPTMEKLLKAPVVNVASTRPSKRLHTRNLITNRDKYFKRKMETSKSTKDISLVIDCSGSMGMVMPDVKAAIAIFNNLARKALVTGNIIFSAGSGYQTVTMPIKNEDIEIITAYSGSEGLNRTFQATIPLLSKSDFVFVMTDGDITDEAVDKKKLQMHNVDPIGIYIGQEARNLSLWFNRSINRYSIEGVVDEIVRKIR